MITELKDNITYVVWQLEVAPETKKMHQQGYVEFKNPTTLVGCKKLLSKVCICVLRGKTLPCSCTGVP